MTELIAAPTIPASGSASGRPGVSPTWQAGRKQGVGTALSPQSRVWFTLARGIVTEAYSPRPDRPSLRDLQFLVSDGKSFVHEEQRDLRHGFAWLEPGVPAFRLTNTDPEGRYRLVKTVLTDPEADALVVRARFEALAPEARGLRLYALLNPQLDGDGAHDSARVFEVGGHTILAAWRDGTALALVSSAPVLEASCGYVGRSDGWRDLHDHFHLEAHFAEALDGNVALIARLEPGAHEFSLVLGFGSSVDAAVKVALGTLGKPYAALETAFSEGWRAYLGALELPRLEAVAQDGGRLARSSAAVLAMHEDKANPGAHVSSLAVPWGESARWPDASGQKLVRPDELYAIATARLAIGDAAAARRAFTWLGAQQRPDGGWPAALRVDGRPVQSEPDLEASAAGILLAWQLREARALGDLDPWPVVRRAAALIAHRGPVVSASWRMAFVGHSPRTLALEIAALTAAAAFARQAGEAALERYWLEVADCWAERVEAWTFTRCGEHVPNHPEHYQRLVALSPDGRGDDGLLAVERVPHRSGPMPHCCLVDSTFLDLVRYGLRAADDPHVEQTLPVVDALLRVETPFGPSWRRHNADRYGEGVDGTPPEAAAGGIGRAWPRLSGERAHYALERGRRGEAERLLCTLECFASGGLLPEQVWDGPDLPERDLRLGRGTGSGAPHAPTHAEYLTLLRSLVDARSFDRVEAAHLRYVRRGAHCNLAIWRAEHPLHAIESGRRLRLEVASRAEVRWSADGWATVHQEPMVALVPGVWAFEVPSDRLGRGQSLCFTLYWPEERRWEGRDFVIGVV